MEIIKSKRGRPATGRAKNASVFVRCRTEQKSKVKEMIKVLLKDFDGFRYTSGVVAEPDQAANMKAFLDEMDDLKKENNLLRIKCDNRDRFHLDDNKVLAELVSENKLLKARIRDLEQTYLSS